MADKQPDNIYRGLSAWERHAAEILDAGWLERVRKEPSLSPWQLLRGPNAVVDHKIKSRLRVLNAVIKDLRNRNAAQDYGEPTGE